MALAAPALVAGDKAAVAYTITSFPGMLSSKTVTFTVGSKIATFFGSPGLKTKYTQAPDGSSGAIIVPKSAP